VSLASGMTEHENGEKVDRGAGLFEGWNKERCSACTRQKIAILTPRLSKFNRKYLLAF
jgi:hypothetical protein